MVTRDYESLYVTLVSSNVISTVLTNPRSWFIRPKLYNKYWSYPDRLSVIELLGQVKSLGDE